MQRRLAQHSDISVTESKNLAARIGSQKRSRHLLLKPYDRKTMRWVRSRLSCCSWSALLALAIQLVLSGHPHLENTRESPSILFAMRSAIESPAATLDVPSAAEQQKPARLADDFCALCAVMRFAGTPAPAPVLPLPIASRFVSVDVDVLFELAASPHNFFSARA